MFGSFRCACLDGYFLGTGNQTCFGKYIFVDALYWLLFQCGIIDQDLDECEDEPCDYTCNNVPGSFQCSCADGFVLHSDNRSCDGMHRCVDGLCVVL